MEQERYQQQYKAFVQQAEQRLNELCDFYLPVKAQISQAARYSLLGGGKRVRAVLVLAACQLAGGDTAAAADYAAALEMLHCYSLIHDDMPCMDNDDYRRGRLSCHKQYGEATALLAADALVTAAFEAVANAPTHPQSRVQAAAHLAKAAGARGMLYGQELDKHYETVHASESELLELHAHKTGALIIAGVDLGCDAAQADDALCTALQHYAAELGLVFQIVDDILDVTATTEELGKPVGSDAENDKTTFITLYGLEGARSLAKQHNDAALAALADLGPEADFLREMAVELLTRSKEHITAGQAVRPTARQLCREPACLARCEEKTTMMTLLREALSWNYVLVTAVISSLLAQFTKVILNLIILGKFIPERLWGAGGMPSAHSATVCALLVATGRYCGTGSTEFALALVLAIIVMYDAMGVRRETGEQAKILNRMLSEWMDRESDAMPFLGDKKLKEMVGHTPIQVLTGAIFGIAVGLLMPMV